MSTRGPPALCRVARCGHAPSAARQGVPPRAHNSGISCGLCTTARGMSQRASSRRSEVPELCTARPAAPRRWPLGVASNPRGDGDVYRCAVGGARRPPGRLSSISCARERAQLRRSGRDRARDGRERASEPVSPKLRTTERRRRPPCGTRRTRSIQSARRYRRVIHACTSRPSGAPTRVNQRPGFENAAISNTTSPAGPSVSVNRSSPRSG